MQCTIKNTSNYSTKVVKKYFQFFNNEQDIKNIINNILQHESVANNYILFQSIESIICRSDAYIKLLNQNVSDDKNLKDQIITDLVHTLDEIEPDKVNELFKSLQDSLIALAFLELLRRKSAAVDIIDLLHNLG
jgi:hypothetical protein